MWPSSTSRKSGSLQVGASPLNHKQASTPLVSEYFFGTNTLPIVLKKAWCNAAFRLACRSPLCCFDGDICTTVQTLLAAQGWPSGKQRLANKSITLPLCPQWQIAYSWLQFSLGATPLCDEPLRQHRSVLTMKLQAVFTKQSGNAASGRLVWKQYKCDKSSVLGNLGPYR